MIHIAPGEARACGGRFNQGRVVNESIEIRHCRKIQKVRSRLFGATADGVEIPCVNPGEGRLSTDKVFPELPP